VKYKKIIFIYAPFFGTRQTHRRIFTHNGSNDVDSRNDVPFLGIFHIAPHLWGQNRPKPPVQTKFGTMMHWGQKPQ